MADITKTVLLQIDLDAESVQKNILLTNDKLDLLHKQLDRARLDLEDMEKAGKGFGASYENARLQITDFELQIKQVTKDKAAYVKQAQLLQLANKGTGSSLQSLQAQLSLLTAKWKGMEEDQRLNSTAGKELAASIAAITDQLKAEESAVGDSRRNVGNYVGAVQSLRQELKDAKDEATAFFRKFGENDARTVEATKKVADLSEQISDFNKRVESLNPEAKFKSIVQAAGSIAGGISAAQSAVALFGGESEALQQTLLKVQAAANFATGLNQLAELGDSIKNIRAAFGAMTVATTAQTAAQETNVAVTEAETVATTELAAAEGEAAAETGVLATAIDLLLGPLGLVILAVGAVVAAFSLMKDDSKQDVKDLTDAIDGENEAHKKVLESINATRDASVAALQGQIDLAALRGKSDQDLFDLRTQLRKREADALRAEGAENAQHINNLIADREKLEKIARDPSANADAQKAANDKLIALDDELHKTRIRNQQIENTEIVKLRNEQAQDEEQLLLKQQQRANEVSNLRISNIQNSTQREIAAVKQARDEQLQVLLKDEIGNSDKIQEIRIAASNKIRDIERDAAIARVDERNKLEIAGTLSGTEERINAEIAAAGRERDVRVKDERLTGLQIAAIRSQSIEKINDLERQRIQVKADLAKQEVELENRTQNAIVQLNKVRASNPEEQLAADLQAITTATQQKMEANIAQQQTDLALNAQFFKAKEDQLKASLDFQKLSEQEKTDAVTKIHQEEADKAAAITEASNAELLALQQTGVFDQNQVIRAASVQRLQDIIAFKQLEMEAAHEGTIAQRDFEKEIAAEQEAEEILKAQQSINTEEVKNREIELIKLKYAKKFSDIDRNRQVESVQVASAGITALSGLLRKGSAEQKAFSSAAALMDTYVAAQKAYTSQLVAGDPTSVARAIIAAVTATIQGLARVAQINAVQFYEGGFDSPTPSGFTGHGSPRAVAHAFSTPRRTIHREEYIIPHGVLRNPLVRGWVDNVVEPLRRNRMPVTSRESFAGGGFAEVPSAISSPGINLAEMRQLVVDTVSSLPPQIVLVEDMLTGINSKVAVESRASF